MNGPKYEAHGKEVLCDGQHFADAIGPESATLIVESINLAATLSERWGQLLAALERQGSLGGESGAGESS